MQKSNLLQDYIFVSKYSRIIGNRKETWEEATVRVFNMHRSFLKSKNKLIEELEVYLQQAEEAYKNQEVLGAQRSLQWGGEQLLKHHFRMYNCAASHADRPRFFAELMYVLLAGAGVGYSVQKNHVDKLPVITGTTNTTVQNIYVVEDSIEGWADAVDHLIKSFFYGEYIALFDYSKIRPKGSIISGGFKAPGYRPLEKAINLLKDVLKQAVGRKLNPIEVHEISCIIADAVISGGVRRSALLSIFSADDDEMMSCKTGNWYYKKPYLARANNSAAILPNTSKETYDKLYKAVKQYGEPGFVFLPNEDVTLNPCVEVGMYPILKDDNDNTIGSGFGVCNLTEINGSKIRTEEDFYKAARNAAIIGTIQATYTDFKYVTENTKRIVERDSLIGVGITGMAENSEILFDPEIQRKAALIVKETNYKIAKLLGINPAARTTVIKPSGNSSSLLGTSSGIHPFHHHRYIRNVQANEDDQAFKIMKKVNPRLITKSVWGKNDYIVSFPIEKDEDKVLISEDLSAIKLLELVKLTQANWIKYGTRLDQENQTGVTKEITHNVSNTITVRPEEWEEVKEFIWENRDNFSGVSLIPSSGDLDYNQSPFIKVYDEVELAEMYGPAAILAGGLNVDGIHAFGDLWTAIDTALGKGEDLTFNKDTIGKMVSDGISNIIGDIYQFEYKSNGVNMTNVNELIDIKLNQLKKKKEWVSRFKKFANKYLAGNLDVTGECLKRVSIFHQWNQIQSGRKVYWEDYDWTEGNKEAGSEIAAACHGGACDINL